MSDYVKATDFQAKDSLLSGNPSKIIKGAEINDEFNAIQTAIATKADLSSPALLGNPTAPTQTTGNNTTRLATTAFVQAQIAADSTNVDITGGTINGVTITGGTVSGLSTDLAVADGGTGSSTLAANAVLLGNGTNALQTVAPGTSGNLLTSNGTTWQSSPPVPVIGTGQTYQNVLGSRVSGTAYTNSTSTPILVVVSSGRANSGTSFTVVVDGVTLWSDSSGIFYATHDVSFIVPVGSTYTVTSSAGFVRWVELR